MLGQCLEEGTAGPEQDGDLVQDHLVDESGLQRAGQDAAAHDGDVLVAGDGAGGWIASAIPVVTRVWRSVIAGAGRWLRTMTGAVGCGLPPPKRSESS